MSMSSCRDRLARQCAFKPDNRHIRSAVVPWLKPTHGLDSLDHMPLRLHRCIIEADREDIFQPNGKEFT